ncbi:MAG: hypothetical protein ACRCSL_16600 [Microbacterium sp.]
MIDDTMTFTEAQAILAAAGLYVHSASYDGTQWHVRLSHVDKIPGATSTAPTLGQALEGARASVQRIALARLQGRKRRASDPRQCPVCGKPECVGADGSSESVSRCEWIDNCRNEAQS